MNIIQYSMESINDLRLTCFCEVIVENNYLVFINDISRKIRRKKGNIMILSILAHKLNERKTVAEIESMLKQWRFDYNEVIKELLEEGYFE